MDAEWVSAIAEAVAALFAPAVVLVAWLSWQAARQGATNADRAAASSERGERIAAEIAELEKRRQYIDLTPQFELTLDRVEHGGHYALWTELVGPPGLNGLDSIKIEVRDDWRDRTYRPSGDLTPEDIARQVWSPLRFAPTSTAPMPPVGARRPDLYANESTRLLLSCTRGDQQWGRAAQAATPPSPDHPAHRWVCGIPGVSSTLGGWRRRFVCGAPP